MGADAGNKEGPQRICKLLPPEPFSQAFIMIMSSKNPLTFLSGDVTPKKVQTEVSRFFFKSKQKDYASS